MLRKLSLGWIVVLAACGSARVIWRTQVGGVIELQGDKSTSMEQANSEMSAHCGASNYTIVAEGYEPVGNDRYYQQNTTSRNPAYAPGGTRTSGYESQRSAMAWRVHYQCNNAYNPTVMPAAAPMEPQPQEPPPPPPPAPEY